MPSYSVYVSPELRSKLDELKTHIDWAALARSTWQKEIDRMDTLLLDKHKAATLRGQMEVAGEKLSAAAFDAGYAAGEFFAAMHATPEELVRIGIHFRGIDAKNRDRAFSLAAGDTSPEEAVMFVRVIGDKPDATYRDAKRFWSSQAVADSPLSAAGLPAGRFVDGFAKAVYDTWMSAGDLG